MILAPELVSQVLAADFLAYQAEIFYSHAENHGIAAPVNGRSQALLPKLWHETGRMRGLAQFAPVAWARRAYEDLVYVGITQTLMKLDGVRPAHQNGLLGDALVQLGPDRVAAVTGKVLKARVIGDDFRPRTFQRLGVPGLKELARCAYDGSYEERDEVPAKMLEQVLKGGDERMRALAAREILLPLQSETRPLKNFDYARAIHEYLIAWPTYFSNDATLLTFVNYSPLILSGVDSKIKSDDVMRLMVYVGEIISFEQNDMPVRCCANDVLTNLVMQHIDFFSECGHVYAQLSPLARLVFLRVVNRISMRDSEKPIEVTRSGAPKAIMPRHEYYTEELWPFSNGDSDEDVCYALRFLERGEFFKLEKFLDTKIAEAMPS